jgi:2-keto-3-deoxy-L-rhamnonate aldolase RhmA
MPSRGRHQTTSKECLRILRRIESMEGVIGVIIGRSYGGKSLGQGKATGALRIQRTVSGGLKAVTQSEKGLQEIFIRTEAGMEERVAEEVREMHEVD